MTAFYVSRWHDYPDLPPFPAPGEPPNEGPRYEWGNSVYRALRGRSELFTPSTTGNGDGVGLSAVVDAETAGDAEDVADRVFTEVLTASGLADDFERGSYEWRTVEMGEPAEAYDPRFTVVDATPTTG